MDELRILVVADDPLARSGLAAVLASQPECTVVGQISSEAVLSGEAAVYQPDVAIWDLGWDPAASPGALTSQEQAAELEDVPFPILALVPDETYASAALTAGCCGLMFRDAVAESLLASLQAIAQGLMVFEPALAAGVLLTRDQPPELLVEELTPRELEVLQLLAEGLSNKAIAHRLEISEHTVKFHVNAILGKLGAQSRTEAAVRATRLGLIIL